MKWSVFTIAIIIGLITFEVNCKKKKRKHRFGNERPDMPSYDQPFDMFSDEDFQSRFGRLAVQWRKQLNLNLNIGDLNIVKKGTGLNATGSHRTYVRTYTGAQRSQSEERQKPMPPIIRTDDVLLFRYPEGPFPPVTTCKLDFAEARHIKRYHQMIAVSKGLIPTPTQPPPRKRSYTTQQSNPPETIPVERRAAPKARTSSDSSLGANNEPLTKPNLNDHGTEESNVLSKYASTETPIPTRRKRSSSYNSLPISEKSKYRKHQFQGYTSHHKNENVDRIRVVRSVDDVNKSSTTEHGIFNKQAPWPFDTIETEDMNNQGLQYDDVNSTKVPWPFDEPNDMGEQYADGI